jgi:hypothetical protein
MRFVNARIRFGAMLAVAGCGFGCTSKDPEPGDAPVGTLEQQLPAGWTPQALAPLAWYVASSDDYKIENGIARWNDRTSNDRDAVQPFGPGQPTLEPAGWDGAPTVRFDGGDLLKFETWTGAPLGNETGFSILAVLRSEEPRDAGIAGWWGGGYDVVWASTKQSNGQTLLDLMRRDGFSQGQPFSVAQDLGVDVAHSVAWRYSPNEHLLKLTIDGVTTTSEAFAPISALSDSMPFIIGAKTLLPTSLFKGKISELVVVGGSIFDDQVDNFTAYASGKWPGLSTPASSDPCVSANGQHAPESVRCDDLDPETYGDHCSSGTCVGETPRLGSPAGYTPVAWYRAAPAEVEVEAGHITKWLDRSPNHFDLVQAFEGGRPTLVTDEWGEGKPSIHFDGSDLLRYDGWNGMPAGDEAEFTLMVVFKSSATAQNAGIASFWGPPSYSRVGLQLKGVGGQTLVDLLRSDGFNTTQHFSDTVDLGGERHIAVWRYSAGVMTLSVDGRTTSSTNLGSIGTVSPGAFIVGATTHLPTGLFSGNIAELALFSDSLSDAAVQRFDQYARADWDVFTFDTDGDGVPDAQDKCPGLVDDQSDGDEDGIGDACEPTRLIVWDYVTEPVPLQLLDTPRTVAFAATTEGDLEINTGIAGGEAGLLATVWKGQELAVFSSRYGYGLTDPGGAASFLPFLHPHGWRYIPDLRYSSVHADPGEAAEWVEYPHNSAHAVRYVHGTCSKRIELQPIFDDIALQLDGTFFCEARKAAEGIDFKLGDFIQATRHHLRLQPHFRGDYSTDPANPRTEMGFFLDADFSIVASIPPARVDIELNPSFVVRATEDGDVRFEVLDQNVYIDGPVPGAVRAKIEGAVLDAPAKFNAMIRDAVDALPEDLAVTCDPYQSTLDSRVACRAGFEAHCENPSPEHAALCLYYKCAAGQIESVAGLFTCPTEPLVGDENFM